MLKPFLKMTDPVSRRECDVLTRYLIGRCATDKVCNRYFELAQKRNIQFTERQLRQWKISIKHPIILAHLDAWFAYADPVHPIRQRILLVFAILETESEFHKYFLPQPRSIIYLISIILIYLWSLLKILTGRLLLWTI
jgi:hypothetical protein